MKCSEKRGDLQAESLRSGHDAAVRHNDVQDDLIGDELELGSIDGAPARKIIPPPPRLCEAGPCVNYHRFEIQLDAERPIAGAIEPGGRMTGAPPAQPFYVRVHHYCYPTVGVETELSGLPVLKCNRWQPKISREVSDLNERQRVFLESAAGRAYTHELAAWTTARAAEAESDGEGDQLTAWITMNLRDGDELEIVSLENSDAESALPTPIRTLDADTARIEFTTSYLETIGPGSYQLLIKRPSDGRRLMVAVKNVEIS